MCENDHDEDFEMLADELKHLHEHLEKASHQQLEVLNKISDQMNSIILLLNEK
ncbi:MAG: hypothetical protein NT004_01565 [Bacteroidetes bacterium]|nr:hypothetical protein [Bacteroidota bacterium]